MELFYHTRNTLPSAMKLGQAIHRESDELTTTSHPHQTQSPSTAEHRTQDPDQEVQTSAAGNACSPQ